MFKIFFCDKKQINKAIRKKTELYYKEVRHFFNLDIPDFKIYFFKSRLSYNAALGRETQNWEVANAYEDIISFLSPNVWNKESTHKSNEFGGILKHEITHLFIDAISKKHPVPRWLDEGLACFVAKQNKKNSGAKIYVEKNFCKKLDTPQGWNQRANYGAYSIACFFVDFLLNKFDFEQIIKIIQNTPRVYTYKKFDLTVKKILGVNLSKLQKEFCNWIAKKS